MKNASSSSRARSARIPGGVNSPVRAFRSVGGTPPFFARAAGAYLWDADGKRYIDYVGSWGPLLAGHAHPGGRRGGAGGRRARAVLRRADRGRDRDGRDCCCRLVPSLELVRLVSSGTEATMTAMRLARGFTGRSADREVRGLLPRPRRRLLVKAGSGALTFGNPSSAGVPAGDRRAHRRCSTTTTSPRSKDVLRRERHEHRRVIVEPVAGNMNLVAARARLPRGAARASARATARC